MRPTQTGLDLLARHVILGCEDDLRRSLRGVQLDAELLGALYLRVRAVLERSELDDIATAEELAMSIFFTATAWEPKGDAPVDLLLSLHSDVSRTLEQMKEGRP
ncbi:MAG TPA: hypothetical protein VG323_13825 [Thermoanaerobaculia bacterium]|nr:hypothetical protein [Thermoanaerobaculia bacterium]